MRSKIFLKMLKLLFLLTLVFCAFNILIKSNWSDIIWSLLFGLSHLDFFQHFDEFGKKAYQRMKTEDCKQQLVKLASNGFYELELKDYEMKNSCESLFDVQNANSYEGCFYDTPSSRLLQGFKYNFSSNNNPDFCVQACLRASFLYAGVEYKDECFCGGMEFKQLDKVKLPEEKCREFMCLNTKKFCGGHNAIAVYFTGITENRHTQVLSFSPLQSYDNSVKPLVKILFLLQLNGRDFRQIKRLLKMIYKPEHLYYVHVDKRQEYLYNEMLDFHAKIRAQGVMNFIVSSNRHACIWGGTSLLLLFLQVISETLNNDQRWSSWDYIVNLSETDLPLLPLEDLEFNLRKNYGKNFLKSHGYNTGSFLSKQGFNFHFFECESRMWRIAQRKIYPRNLRLDGGSDWIVIHRDLAIFSLTPHLPILQFFETVLLPLESFYHTLAINSHFCDKIVYQNLRLINWRRKQGCRCASFAPVVDWCGCSPLAIHVSDVRLEAASFRDKMQFFGRKFDPFIDTDSIAFVEKIVLNRQLELDRNRLDVMSINSTWVNTFSSKFDSPKSECHDAVVEFSQSLFEIAKRVYPMFGKCEFDRLVETFAFKPQSHASPQSIVSIEIHCSNVSIRIEMLAQEKDGQSVIIHHEVQTEKQIFNLVHPPKFGLDFDLKEEVFRKYPTVVNKGCLSNAVIMWAWNSSALDNKSVKIHQKTSPLVNLKLISPREEVFSDGFIKPYDSINGVQFSQLGEIILIPGSWRAQLLSAEKLLAELKFPVGSSTSLVESHFQLSSLCIIQTDASNEGKRQIHISDFKIPHCKSSVWSSVYPDPKSEFEYHPDIKILQ